MFSVCVTFKNRVLLRIGLCLGSGLSLRTRLELMIRLELEHIQLYCVI